MSLLGLLIQADTSALSQGQIELRFITNDDVTSFPDRLGAEIQTLAIGLNLYMVSQNCLAAPARNPLTLPKPPARFKSLFAGSGGASTDTRFTGIIYANGTIDNNPPPNFHLGRVKILKAGTVFANGTVLQVDTPNPDYDAPF